MSQGPLRSQQAALKSWFYLWRRLEGERQGPRGDGAECAL